MPSGRGRYHPPNCRKICEKTTNAINLRVLSQSSWTALKTIFETLWALGACRVTIRRCGMNEIPDFRGFWECLSKFLTFLHKIFFGSKILTSSCDHHQKFDHGCSSYPGNETQSADFGHFFWQFGVFLSYLFWHNFMKK